MKRIALTEDEKYMKEAIRQAKKAYALGEVPIGCVIVYEGKIIGRGYNRRNTDKNTLAHAELSAIRKASKKTGDWRLEDCTMYVTLEPCPMCAGAIILARIGTVIWGLSDPKRGGGTTFHIFDHPGINHHPQIVTGILEEPCRTVLVDFFRRQRAEKDTAKLMESDNKEHT